MNVAPTSARTAGLDETRIFAVQMMQHLVVPTFVIDAHGRVIIWNLACERLTGLAAASMIGTNEHWRAFYKRRRPCLADLVLQHRPEEIDRLYSVNRSDAFADGGLSAENWCEPPNGQGRRYLAFDAGPIFDETGNLLAVVETMRDITVQKEAQIALEALASLDGLTGIPNRRHFDQVVQEEWSRAARTGRPLSLLMVDIDHFKLYNDSLGHQHGDECLKLTAALLTDAMPRSGDFVARYGGEEFAVVLPGIDLAGAMGVAEGILGTMATAAMPHPGHPPVVTVSIGAASFSHPVVSPQMLISTADASLYRAKRSGRNCVVAAQHG
jgi:diguanylate cyclase (GGDEF)-like protein